MQTVYTATPTHKKTRVEPTTTYYHALMMGIRNREGPLLDCFAWWAPRSHVVVPRYCLQHNVRDRWQVEQMWINSCRHCTQPPPPHKKTRVEPTTTYYHALMMGIRNREGPLLDCFAWWAPRSHVVVPRYCLQHNVRDRWQVETYYHALMMGIRNREGPLLDCFAWWAPRSHVLVPRYCLQHNVRDRWQVETYYHALMMGIRNREGPLLDCFAWWAPRSHVLVPRYCLQHICTGPMASGKHVDQFMQTVYTATPTPQEDTSRTNNNILPCSNDGNSKPGGTSGRMPDSQSREPGFESPLIPFRSLGIFFHFTTPQSTQLYKWVPGYRQWWKCEWIVVAQLLHG